MNTLIRSGILGLAGSVGVGLLALGTGANASTASGKDQATLNKRDDLTTSWVVADDDHGDDDDDTGTNTRSRSRMSHDGTNSRHTAVSRDHDRSRGDLTRDWTRDEGDHTKDHSRFQTNDHSRHDTRHSWR